jgi:transcriptional regulator with XRE-family HTH domain
VRGVRRSRDTQAPSPSRGDLTKVLGANLRRLRTARGLSLEQLARASGVSRSMLWQIELGHSAPTINVVAKVASALAVSFGALLVEPNGDGTRPGSAEEAPVSGPAPSSGPVRAKAFASREQWLQWAEVTGLGDPRALVFYALELAPHSALGAGLPATGGGENVLVVEGSLALSFGEVRYELSAGDVLFFEAHVPYEYRNEGATPVRIYVVMTHERARHWQYV